MSNYWDTSTAITYGVTPPSSADAIRDLSSGGTQTPGALGAIGSRILAIPDLTTWTISAGTASGFKVSPGSGIAYDSSHTPVGWAFLWTTSNTDNQSTGLQASLEQFIIASVVYASVVGDPDSRESGATVFTAQSTPTPPTGGILIGGVTTNGASVVTSAWSRGVDLNSVRAIATTAITLSGTQTVDGVTLAVGDLCAVNGQADQTTNDIYIVSANVWNKAPLNYIGAIWHNGASFWVRSGTLSANTRWQLTTADPVTRGSSNIVFARLDGNFVHLTGNETIAGTKTFSTGPVIPTAAVDTNTTQAASTAFVLAQAASATPLIDGTATVGTSTRFARGDHIHPTDTSRAPIASPTLTGTPAAPTASPGTNTTQVATTAFVAAAIVADNTALKSPKPLFDHYVDAPNSTTTETDLYADTTAAGQLTANGDKIEASYGGILVSSGTATREFKLYFGGTAIFDTGALTFSLSASWNLYATLIRVSATVVRYMVRFDTEGTALAAYTAVGELTGLTLSGTNILKATGQSSGIGAASNDIVAKIGYVVYVPAA